MLTAAVEVDRPKGSSHENRRKDRWSRPLLGLVGGIRSPKRAVSLSVRRLIQDGGARAKMAARSTVGEPVRGHIAQQPFQQRPELTLVGSELPSRALLSLRNSKTHGPTKRGA